jgi:hypothetical protein
MMCGDQSGKCLLIAALQCPEELCFSLASGWQQEIAGIVVR